MLHANVEKYNTTLEKHCTEKRTPLLKSLDFLSSGVILFLSKID
jgi:hypothetical protein